MLKIKDARKELIRIGCGQAKGDALRFMYANLLAFEQRLSVEANSINWLIPTFYELLGTVPDDEIRNMYKQLQGDIK